jgi:hypothetical protein
VLPNIAYFAIFPQKRPNNWLKNKCPQKA